MALKSQQLEPKPKVSAVRRVLRRTFPPSKKIAKQASYFAEFHRKKNAKQVSEDQASSVNKMKDKLKVKL
jgi:hypothetical protein